MSSSRSLLVRYGAALGLALGIAAGSAPASADSFYFAYGNGPWHPHGRRHPHGRWHPHHRHRVVVVRPAPRVVYVAPPPVVYIPAPVPYAPPVAANADSPVYRTADGRYCREYQATVNVGGTLQRSYGTACLQPDGAWQIVN